MLAPSSKTLVSTSRSRSGVFFLRSVAFWACTALIFLGRSAVMLLMRFDMTPNNDGVIFCSLDARHVAVLYSSLRKKEQTTTTTILNSLVVHIGLYSHATGVGGNVCTESRRIRGLDNLRFTYHQFSLRLESRSTISTSYSNLGRKPVESIFTAAMLLPLILFGIWVYPHTDAAFGGGEPTTAEMSILPTSGSSTLTTVSVKLVDETDAGFYVIEANDSRVRYIPRNVVTSVSFDKPKGWY